MTLTVMEMDTGGGRLKKRKEKKKTIQNLGCQLQDVLNIVFTIALF